MMNVKREIRIHRFVVQLFEEDKRRFEKNAEERTVSSGTRKSCKHYVGQTKQRNTKDFPRDRGQKGMKYRHNKLCFCNQEDSLHYRNKHEALSESKERVGVRRKDRSTMLYNYNKTPQMYKPTQNLTDPN